MSLNSNYMKLKFGLKINDIMFKTIFKVTFKIKRTTDKKK